MLADGRWAVMAGLSRFVLRHKLVVAVFWLAVLAVGVVASARLSGRLSAQFALPPGSTVAVTGMNELASGGQAREGFGVLAETLLAGAAALGVLLFVFGSALAVVPLAMAAVAIPACFAALYGLTEITTVSVIV